MKKIQWKYRMIMLMCIIVFVVILSAFTSVYQLFMDTMQETMLETTTNAFIQAEKNIGRKLESAELAINRILYTDILYNYERNQYADEVEKSVGMIGVIKEFDRVLSENLDLFGIGIITDDRRIAASTKRSRTIGSEYVKVDEDMERLFDRSIESYPNYLWIGNFSEYLESNSGLQILVQEPVIVGIRPINDHQGNETRRSYLIVAMKESAIEECYSQILYRENDLMLLSDQRIISATDKSRIAGMLPYAIQDGGAHKISQYTWKKAEERESYQIIQYNTVLEDWILINEVPKTIYENQIIRLKKTSFLIGVVTIFSMCLFFILWILKYANPIQRLMNGMRRVEEGEYTLLKEKPIGISELDALNDQFNSMTQKLGDSIRRLRENEETLRVEELRTLQFQINPHFLLNTINTIRWMAMMSNNTNVADALVVLNKIIYPILKAPSFWGTVKEELEFTDNYIQMLKLRFSSTLTYKIECDEELYDLDFPRFILQPIIENCFTHGIVPGQPFFVETVIENREGIFHVHVHNSGKPVERLVMADLNAEFKKVKQREFIRENGEEILDSIGLRNVRKRLALLHGEASKMWLESDFTDGTSVYIEFPIIAIDKVTKGQLIK